MNILAIDLGSTTGFAIGSKEHYESGVVKLNKQGWVSDDSFFLFDTWLSTAIHNWDVKVVVLEKPNSRMPSWHGLRVHFGLFGLIQSVCGQCQLSHLEVPAKTIKKFLTGKGTASKEEMVEFANKYKDVTDHNEADALGIFHYYWEVQYVD